MADKQIGLAIAGFAGFQLLQAWNNNAPALSELREAEPGDSVTRQKLLDADALVGGTAVILGTTVAILTKDTTPLVVMAVMFSAIAYWHHRVLKSEVLPDYGY